MGAGTDALRPSRVELKSGHRELLPDGTGEDAAGLSNIAARTAPLDRRWEVSKPDNGGDEGSAKIKLM